MGNWVSILQAGGSMVVPLLLASIVSVGLIFELSWTLRAARQKISLLDDDRRFTPDELAGRDPASQLLRWKVAHPESSRAATLTAWETITAAVERRVSWLGLIAAIAPLLGLIGTVFGMIRIFHQVSLEQPANPISALAGGISEALVATAGGLIVAVIAALGQHALNNALDALALEEPGTAGMPMEGEHALN